MKILIQKNKLPGIDVSEYIQKFYAEDIAAGSDILTMSSGNRRFKILWKP